MAPQASPHRCQFPASHVSMRPCSILVPHVHHSPARARHVGCAPYRPALLAVAAALLLLPHSLPHPAAGAVRGREGAAGDGGRCRGRGRRRAASRARATAGGVEGEGDGGRPSARQRIGEDEKWRRRALVFIAAPISRGWGGDPRLKGTFSRGWGGDPRLKGNL